MGMCSILVSRLSKWWHGLAHSVSGKGLQKGNIGDETSAGIQAVSATTYAVATGKEILTILDSAADLIPVPMLKQAIQLAQKIIELCEEASAVGEKAKQLQNRVGHLMVVILAHVTDKNEEGDKEVIVNAALLMEGDIQELLKTLDTVNNSLVELRKQNRWMMVVYKDLHKERLDECMDRLAVALEKFKLANDLSDSDLLRNLESRLQILGNQVGEVARDMGDVLITLDRVEHKVDNFAQVMAKVKSSAALPFSDGMVPHQTMPLKPGVFYGRDSFVGEVTQLLMEDATSRVCILGTGGMGKTSVSLAVIESPFVQARFGERCVWVPCIGATSAALLLETLHVQLRIPGEKQITLEKVISELSNSVDPRLILLDNFETPWYTHGGSQKQVEDILRRIAQLNHVAILMTMRGSFPPCDDSIRWQSKNIQPTDERASLQIYHAINPRSQTDPEVDVRQLLHALGYMPFAVTLMASLGKEGRSTAKELLKAWSKSGPSIISGDLEKSMDRSIELSVESDLVKHNPDALHLLHVLSLLPAGTTKENIPLWAPTLEPMLPAALSTLSKAGLLSENVQQGSNSSILFVVPVVQSFMQQGQRIPEEVREQIHSSCCRYVLANACHYDDSDFHEKSKALAAEDSNIQSILFGPSGIMPSNNLPEATLDALIAFSWYRCYSQPSPDLAKHALAAAAASGTEQHKAIVEWCIGRTYHFVSQYALAYQHLKKAYELFSPPGDLQWQKLGGKCGIDLVDSSRFELTNEQVVQLAYEVEARCANLFDNRIHGRSLCYLGLALQRSGQMVEALQYLYHAKVKLEPAGSALDVAEIYQYIGRAHHQQQQIPEALGATEEAWKHAQTCGVPSVHGDISLELGVVLYSANRDADARQYIELALALVSQVGTTSDVGIALEYMGYGYLRQGDYQDAHNAYNAAAAEYTKCKWNRPLERCRTNMDKLLQKLSNSDMPIGFLRPQWDPDGSLFYPGEGNTKTDASLAELAE